MADEYECDECGACCRNSIVEVYELDCQREPKVAAAATPFKELGEGGEFALLYDHVRNCCPLLGEDNRCTTYPTRPTCCVGMQAGGEQCQAFREQSGLEPLKPLKPVESC